MTNKFVVLNEDKNDCAAACLSSIIKYYNGYLDMETIKEIIHTGKNGTNAYDLINGSKEIGFNAYGKKVLLNEIINYKIKFPVIAHVKKANLYHFVVIYEIDTKRNKLLIMDPSIGFIKVPISEFEKNYLGTLLFFEKIKELPKKIKSNKLLKEILVNLLKDKKTLFLLFISSLVTFIFSLIDTYYYKIILDNKIINKEYYIKLLYIFGTFIILKNLFNYFRNKLIIRANYNLEIFINKKVINKIFNLPYAYYKNKTTGEIISRLNDLNNLRDLLSDIMLNAFVNILLIIISFIIMMIVNFKLSIIGIIIIIIYYLIVKLYRNFLNTKIRILQENKAIYNNELMEDIEALESIRNLNIKEIRLNNIYNSYKSKCDVDKQMNISLNRQQFLKNITYDLGTIIILTSGVLMVLTKKLEISDVIFIYMIISYFINLIKNVLDKDIEINYNLRNLEKINTMLSIDEIKDNSKLVKGNIIIQNLKYKYSDRYILDNINLEIKEKSKIIIKGKSGCGKSTLIKIILKYFNDYNGNVFIGKNNYKEISENQINNSFTYIGQNEKIFAETFKNNIILNRNINNSDYENVIKICELDSIRKNNDDFLIEESGFNLSGGEKQRIILARALLKHSNYIIIDEALSEVDVEIEKKIIKNINEYFKDKTIIYVSHKEEIQNLFNISYDVERRIYEERRIS